MNQKVKVSQAVYDAVVKVLEHTKKESLLLVHAAMVTGSYDRQWAGDLRILNNVSLWDLAQMLIQGFEVEGSVHAKSDVCR